MALGLCALLTLLQVSMGGEGPRAVLAGLALALALLPNEIPVVVSLFLALGALRLSRIGVLARWPAAVESLGSATVLAVDKTGTLTQNRMAVQALLTWPQQEHWQTGSPLAEPWHRLLELAVLASRHDPVDAMEQAIQRLARQELEGSEHFHPDWPLPHDYPLRSDLLVVSKLWRDAQGRGHLAAKGAPEATADLCHLDATARGELLGAAERLALSGLRVLAVAVAPDALPRHAPGRLDGSPEALLEPPEDVHDLEFAPVGLLALADPLRPEVPAAIARARRAGARVLMITPRSQRLALRQGIALALAAAVLLSWPDLAADTRRSLVFALLLLGGGTLVWINGGRSGRTAAGPLLELSFCTLLALVAPLRQALALGPMGGPELLLLAATLIPAPGAAALAAREPAPLP